MKRSNRWNWPLLWTRLEAKAAQVNGAFATIWAVLLLDHGSLVPSSTRASSLHRCADSVIEWQKRGYPHAHILLWADVPHYGHQPSPWRCARTPWSVEVLAALSDVLWHSLAWMMMSWLEQECCVWTSGHARPATIASPVKSSRTWRRRSSTSTRRMKTTPGTAWLPTNCAFPCQPSWPDSSCTACRRCFIGSLGEKPPHNWSPKVETCRTTLRTRTGQQRIETIHGIIVCLYSRIIDRRTCFEHLQEVLTSALCSFNYHRWTLI